MIDRALGLLGIALAIVTPIVQYYFPQLPRWTFTAGVAVGSILVGISLGLISAGGLRRKRIVRSHALLRMHVYGDHRSPTLVEQDNIFRWFYLQNEINAVGAQGTARIGTLATLYVSFEEDVVIHTLAVQSPDIALPIYEVKEFNQRYAIIYFSSSPGAGTLEIRVGG